MKSDLFKRITLALAVITITFTTGNSVACAQAGGLYTWKDYPDKYTIGGPCYAGAPSGYALIHNPTTGYEQCAAISDMKPVTPQQVPAAPAVATPVAAAAAQAAPAPNAAGGGGLYTWKEYPDKYTIGGPCYPGAPAGYALIHNQTTGYEQCAAISDMKPVVAGANPLQPPAPTPTPAAAPLQNAPPPATPQPTVKPVSYGTNSTCAVGQKVLAEPGDHPATVLATSNMACRVHYDDGAFQDSWVETYNIKPADIYAKNAALAAAGPRLGRYNIAVGTGAYDGYLMIYSASSYELFLPSGTSAGKGTYTFNQANTSISWTSGPLTDPRWDGTQKLDGNGKMLNIRIGKRSVATNTGP